MTNKDENVIKELGEEWIKFNYEALDEQKLEETFGNISKFFRWISCQKMLSVLIWIEAQEDGRS